MLRLAHLAGCLAACMCPPGMTAWAVPRGLPHAQAGAHRPALGGGSSSSRAVVWPWLPRQCWRLTAHSGGLWGWPLGLASWCHAPRVTVKAMCLMRWLCVVPEGQWLSSGDGLCRCPLSLKILVGTSACLGGNRGLLPTALLPGHSLGTL